MTGVARQDSGGPFVESDGRRFESPELDAPEGTDVDVEPYMGIGDVPRATLRWTVFESSYVVEATEVSS